MSYNTSEKITPNWTSQATQMFFLILKMFLLQFSTSQKMCPLNDIFLFNYRPRGL